MLNKKYVVEEENNGLRLDKYLALVDEDITRSRIQTEISLGNVLLNGSAVKNNTRIKTNDVVEVNYREDEELDAIAEDIDIDIVYEDSDVVVINKGKGMVVHPSATCVSGTLVNALLFHIKDLSGINGVLRPGIVHRIDKDTTGLLVVAKNDNAHKLLSKQLEDKTISRKYMALVHGVITHDYGTVDAPIGRDEKDRQKMDVTAKNSKSAITHFKVVERFKNHSLIECQLETGRTHQIRVHMKYIKHPIVGDPKYSYRKTLTTTNGQVLHAYKLKFVHPTTKKEMEFSVDLPDYFNELLEELRLSQ